jgi:two-component system sensor histidine kinase/response regulator
MGAHGRGECGRAGACSAMKPSPLALVEAVRRVPLAGPDSLSRHVLWRVVGFSLLLSLTATLLAARVNHVQASARWRAEVAAIVAAYRLSLGKAAWELDEEAVRVQLNGLRHVPAVLSAEVTGSNFQVRHGQALPDVMPADEGESVPLLSPDGAQVVATWRIRFDQAALRAEVLAQTLNFVALVVPQLLLMAGLVFWLIKRRVSLPVAALSAHVASLSRDRLAVPAPEPASRPDNELHGLARGITRLQVSLSAQLAHGEQVAEALSLQRDQLNALLSRQSQHFDEVLRQMADGAGVLNGQGEICLANKAWAVMMGAASDPSALQGKEMAWLSSPDWSDIRARLDQEGQIAACELLLRRLDGHTLPAEASLSVMEASAQGQALRIQIVLRDVSQRRETERALIQAREDALETSRAKSAFMANISHEIRTPLNAVIGLTELALRTPLSDVQRDYLDKSRQAAHALLFMINDVLDFSRGEAGATSLAPAPFQLPALLDAVSLFVSPQALVKGLVWRLDADTGLPAVWLGDGPRLKQVLITLCANALKFTERGEIVLRVQAMRSDEHGPTRLAFTVSDTGIGMNEAQRAQLFQPFFQGDHSPTRRHGGTGLGLAVSQQWVKLMGGLITVSSQVDQGSVFHLSVDMSPVHAITEADPQTALAARLPSPVASKPLHGLTVLLVEDNAMNQQVASEILAQAGAVVTVAPDGQAALDCLAQQAVDAVLMDIQMPVMDGHEATRRLRSNPAWSALPVIAMTAHATAHDREAALAAGMNDFLTKPIDHVRLMSVLRHWCHRCIQEAPAHSPMGTVSVAVVPRAAAPAALPLVLPGVDVAEGLARCAGRMALFERLLGLFAQGHGEASAQLRSQIDAGDWPAAARKVHVLKADAATLGATQLAQLTRELEVLILRADTDAVAVALTRFDAALSEVLAGLSVHARQALASAS